MNAETLVRDLRAGCDVMQHDVASQQLYEYWLKLESWRARAEALPLVIGIAPDRWQTHLIENKLHGKEADFWSLFASALELADAETEVSVDALRSWCRDAAVELPAALTRLHDFIRQVTLQTEPPDTTANVTGDGSGDSDEKVIVLGAALSLLSKMPDKCRDEHGFADGRAIVELIKETAVRWFPQTSPSMTEHQMVELIDKWLE